MSSDPPEVPRKTNWSRRFRLGIAIILLVVYAIAAIWFYRECVHVRIADVSGAVSSETTCAPPTLTSATVLVMLLLVVALLWPDISEVAVLGVSLKRQVAQAKATAENARESVETVRAMVRFQQTQIEAVTTSSATSTMHVHFNEGRLGADEKARLRRQAEEVRSEMQAPTPEAGGHEWMDQPDAELHLAVLSRYEILSDLLGLTVVRGNDRRAERDLRRRDIQRYFIEDHAGPIKSVRAVRNAIAHAQPVSRQELEDALVLLADLIPSSRLQLDQRGVGEDLF